MIALHVNGKVINSQLVAPNTVRFTGECGAGDSFTVTGTKNEVRSLLVIS